MSRADELRARLIRHVDEVKLERQQRDPLYDTRCGRVSAEICGYPDSGKVNAYARGVRLLQRAATNLDHWDGEP